MSLFCCSCLFVYPSIWPPPPPPRVVLYKWENSQRKRERAKGKENVQSTHIRSKIKTGKKTTFNTSFHTLRWPWKQVKVNETGTNVRRSMDAITVQSVKNLVAATSVKNCFFINAKFARSRLRSLREKANVHVLTQTTRQVDGMTSYHYYTLSDDFSCDYQLKVLKLSIFLKGLSVAIVFFLFFLFLLLFFFYFSSVTTNVYEHDQRWKSDSWKSFDR